MSKGKLNVKYRIEYSDGRSVEAVAKPKDFVAFERQYDMPFYEATRFEHICYLAWAPLHRGGQEARAFDEFMSDVDDVEAG